MKVGESCSDCGQWQKWLVSQRQVGGELADFRRFIVVQMTIEMEMTGVWLVDDGESGGDVG